MAIKGHALGGHGRRAAELSFKAAAGTSLVVQRLRVRLPMQGTRVRSLTAEDSTEHNYRSSRALEPVLWNRKTPRSKKHEHHN